MDNQYIEKIPAWSLCYLINADASGLTDEDIQQVDSWWEKNKVQFVCPVNNNIDEEIRPYFTSVPAFGLACDVVDCVVVYNN
jgi:hypothetical protein